MTAAVALGADEARPGPLVVERWLAAAGDGVEAGEPLVAVRVDDTELFVRAPATGILVAVRTPAGGHAKIGETLAELSETGPGISADALVERIEAATDPYQESLATLLALLEDDDPDLGEAIRICAIPRRFDPELVGLLTDVGDEDARRLFTRIAEQEFVQLRLDGKACYDDAMRAMLLDDWRERARRPWFNELNGRMQRYYDRVCGQSSQYGDDLRRVGPTMRGINPARYSELASTIEGGLRSSLLEILYHSAAISGRELVDRFQDLAVFYESRGQLSLCVSLVHSAKKYLRQRHPGSDQVDWLVYWNGRLQGSMGDDLGERAAEDLRRLLDRGPADTRLRQLTLDTLGGLLYEQDRLPEALEHLRAAIGLADKTGTDLWHLSNMYARLAVTESAVGAYDDAITHSEKAREIARTAVPPNLGTEASAELFLSLSLFEVGRSRDALVAALRGLHLLRAGPEVHRDIEAGLLNCVACLTAATDPRLAETTFAEACRLTDDPGDGARAPDWPVRFAAALVDCGRLSEAERVLRGIRESSDRRGHGLESMLANERTRLDLAAGRLDDVLTETGEPPPARMWERLEALSHRGVAYAHAGAWNDAERDLREALSGWQGIGSVMNAGRARLDLGDLERRRGRLSEAAGLVEQAGHVLRAAGPRAEAEYCLASSRLALARGRAAEAATDARRAAALEEAVGRPGLRLQALLLLARCESGRAEWSSAALAAEDAGRVARELANADGWRLPDIQESADRVNADAADLLSRSADDGRGIELLRSASAMMPDHPWYHLNLAWAHARLGEPGEAVRALERVLDLPGVLPERVLREQLIEFQLRELDARDQPTPEFRQEALATLRAAGDEAAHVMSGRLGMVLDLRKGDLLAREDEDLPAAEDAYRRGMALAEGRHRKRDIARFSARLAVSAARTGRLAAVVRFAVRALSVLPAKTAGSTLADDCREAGLPWHRYALLTAALSLIDEGDAAPAVRRAAADARITLAAARGPMTEAEEPAAEPPALAIAADGRLFPDGDRTPGARWMLLTGIPALRDRLIARVGLRLPPVRIRPLPAGARGYAVTKGHATLTAGPIPAENEPDPYAFLVRELELLMLAEPVRLLTVDEIRRLAEEHGGPGLNGAELFEPGRPERLRLLLAVCDGLLAEGIPVTAFATVVDAVLSAETAGEPVHVSDVVARLRACLAADIPDRRDAGPLLLLPADLEQQISDCLLGQPGYLTGALSWEVRSRIASDLERVPSAQGLVVRRSELRPLIRKLVTPLSPDLQVVTASEVAGRSGAVPIGGVA